MAAAAILDNFEWPYLRNSPRSTYIARIARSFCDSTALLLEMQMITVKLSRTKRCMGILQCQQVAYAKRAEYSAGNYNRQAEVTVNHRKLDRKS